MRNLSTSIRRLGRDVCASQAHAPQNDYIPRKKGNEIDPKHEAARDELSAAPAHEDQRPSK